MKTDTALWEKEGDEILSKLIDAEKLDLVSYQGIPNGYKDSFDNGVLYAMNLIDEQPTVDAVPVVHGYWKGYRFPKYRGNDDFGEPIFKEYVAYTCSNCRKQNAIRHKYCPMCGAIMDGVME